MASSRIRLSHIFILGAIFLVALALFLSLALRSESAPPNVGVTLDDIADDPVEFYGDVVTVSGKVDEVLTERAFTIGESDVLVLSAEPWTHAGLEPLDTSRLEGEVVQVTGLLRDFKLDDAVVELDPEDLDAFTRYAGRPVIVADSISLNPSVQAAREPPPEVSVPDIADDPEEFYGETVIVVAEVNRVIGPSAFTIGGELPGIPPPEMLVIAADGLPPGLPEDEPVRVLGVVRPLDLAEIETEVGIDLDEDLVGEWEDEAVIVAESVLSR